MSIRAPAHSIPENTMSALAGRSLRRSGRAPDDVSWDLRNVVFSRGDALYDSDGNSCMDARSGMRACDSLDRPFDRLVASLWERPQ